MLEGSRKFDQTKAPDKILLEGFLKIQDLLVQGSKSLKRHISNLIKVTFFNLMSTLKTYVDSWNCVFQAFYGQTFGQRTLTIGRSITV